MNEHGALVDDTDREVPKYSERERSVPVPFYPSQIAHVTEPGPPLRHIGDVTCWCHLVGVKMCVGYCVDVISYGSGL